MKITVIGAGAMGGLFGALLTEAGQRVSLVDTRADHVAAIHADGLKIEGPDGLRRVRIAAATCPEDTVPADLVLVFVKSYHTREAALSAASVLADGGVALTLQNGMGNAEQLAETVSPQRVLAGTTAHGATQLGPGHIRHAGRGPTVIGPWIPDSHKAALGVAALFHQAGIETRVVENVRQVIWEKLLVNVGINAITALTGIRNGQLLDREASCRLSRAAVEEAAAVARAAGIAVRDDIVAHVFAIARATAANRSSMGQDVDRKRPAEIGAINGIVVKEGALRKVPTPVNETLSALVETLEAHYR